MDNELSVKQKSSLLGIPASGKTAFFTEYFMDEYIHINPDTLHAHNKETALMAKCISEGKSFVVDNTNPMISGRQRYCVRDCVSGNAVKRKL